MVGLVGGSTARAEHVVANAGGEAEYVRRMHRHAPTEHQCTSTLVKHIKAPVHLVCPPPSTLLFPTLNAVGPGGSAVGLPRVWAAISLRIWSPSSDSPCLVGCLSPPPPPTCSRDVG
jgi:hypothetical protein